MPPPNTMGPDTSVARRLVVKDENPSLTQAGDENARLHRSFWPDEARD